MYVVNISIKIVKSIVKKNIYFFLIGNSFFDTVIFIINNFLKITNLVFIKLSRYRILIVFSYVFQCFLIIINLWFFSEI